MFDVILPIIQTGAVGAMLILTWRLMVKKDKKSYEMIDAMNKERQQLYITHSEMVAEVTTALTDKNHTDEAMSKALEKLVEELRQLRGRL